MLGYLLYGILFTVSLLTSVALVSMASVFMTPVMAQLAGKQTASQAFVIYTPSSCGSWHFNSQQTWQHCLAQVLGGPETGHRGWISGGPGGVCAEGLP